MYLLSTVQLLGKDEVNLKTTLMKLNKLGFFLQKAMNIIRNVQNTFSQFKFYILSSPPGVVCVTKNWKPTAV